MQVCVTRGQRGYTLPLFLLSPAHVSLSPVLLRTFFPHISFIPSLSLSVLVCFLPILRLSFSIFSQSFMFHAFLDSLSLSFLSSLSVSFHLLSMLMDFTVGGHPGLLLRSGVSEMCLIFLLNWIICIYLLLLELTPILSRGNMRAF